MTGRKKMRESITERETVTSLETLRGKKDYNDSSEEQTPFHREELHENKKW